MTTDQDTDLRTKVLTPTDYDLSYYGETSTPTANYRRYITGTPHWPDPLATWLIAHTQGPWLDVGAGVGYLSRALTRQSALRRPIASPRYDPTRWRAVASDWSPYAFEHAVVSDFVQADARSIADHFPRHEFGCITSMDCLEHLEPPDTLLVMDNLDRLLRPGGLSIHLIGWPMPGDDSHEADATHRNHQPIGWYRRAFGRRRHLLDKPLTIALNRDPVLGASTWKGRWQVYRKLGDA